MVRTQVPSTFKPGPGTEPEMFVQFDVVGLRAHGDVMLGLLLRHPLVVALSGVVALLLVVIGLEAGFGSSLHGTMAAAPARRATPFEAKLLPSLAASQPEQAVPGDHRPPALHARRAGRRRRRPRRAPCKSGQFVLQGVTIVGDNRIAMLLEKASGKVHRVEKGKEVNGVKVAEIEPRIGDPHAGRPSRRCFRCWCSSPSTCPPWPRRSDPSARVRPARDPWLPRGGLPAGFAPKAAPAGSAAFDANPQRGVVNPPVPALPQATGVPELPEALLARRRARRAQQTP